MTYPLAFLLHVLLLAQASHAPLAHAWASVQAETRGISAELLLAQSYKESRWTGDSVSRVEARGQARARVAGTWKGKFPSWFKPPYFCGASQLERYTEKSCKSIGLDLNANYTEAVTHIQAWLKFCKRKGKTNADSSRLDCAMAGYGGGVKATQFKGRAWRYGQNTQAIGRAYARQERKILTGKPPVI